MTRYTTTTTQRVLANGQRSRLVSWSDLAASKAHLSTPATKIVAVRLARITARIERASARRYAHGPGPSLDMWRAGWCRAKSRLLEQVDFLLTSNATVLY